MGTWKDDWNDFKKAFSIILVGVGFILASLPFIVMGYFGITHLDEIGSAASDGIESVKDAMRDCDDLQKEIERTERCLHVSNCTLTRDELTKYDEYQQEFSRYCLKK